MLQGRSYRGTTQFTAYAVTLGLRQAHSRLRGIRVLLLGACSVHKTDSGSSQLPIMYCLAANDSSLKQSRKHSFLHCLSYLIEWILP